MRVAHVDGFTWKQCLQLAREHESAWPWVLGRNLRDVGYWLTIGEGKP